MNQQAASRIQSAIDKKGPDATPAEKGFKARASAAAAAKNANNGGTKSYYKSSGCGGCSYSRK